MTWDQSISAGNCRRPQREETDPWSIGWLTEIASPIDLGSVVTL